MPAGKIAFVTGANGITGSYLVEHLLSRDDFSRVIATSRRPPNPDWVARDLPPDAMKSGKLTWFQADLVEESLDALTKKFKEANVGDASYMYWGVRTCFWRLEIILSS